MMCIEPLGSTAVPKASDFPSYAGFVPNLYLQIQALSGKPEIENAASRPATDFMLSGFKMPTTN